MARYLEMAAELRKDVNILLEQVFEHGDWLPMEKDELATKLGHIINLAVRCNPRQPQGTVRKNIVATAMKDYCKVTMTQETDERTGREYNKIHIVPRT